MIPLLIQSIEKAANQSTQVALVTEAVSAANILVRLSLVDINAGKRTWIKTAESWSVSCEMEANVKVNTYVKG